MWIRQPVCRTFIIRRPNIRYNVVTIIQFVYCIVYGFFPDHLISSVLIYIVKDKSGYG